MNIDSFVITLLFDTKATQQSADKIQGIVDNLSKSIIKGFAAIGAMDFLKSAVDGFVQMSTELDNLSYNTKANTAQLQAWQQAVLRNGGTISGFNSSISNLSAKLREMQTSFGSEGQLAFAKLGINVKNANGSMKTSIQVLTELGDKFKNLPQAWRFKLAEQLGLDQATMRTISEGNVKVSELVGKMQQLGLTNQNNTAKGVAFRNTMLDLNLVWQSLSNTMVQLLLPPLEKFAEIAIGVMVYVRNHSYLVQAALIAISTVVTLIMIPAFLRLMVTLRPFFLTAGIIALIAIGIEDLIGWVNGADAAFGDFWTTLFGSREHAKELYEQFKAYIPLIGELAVAFIVLWTVMGASSAAKGVGSILDKTGNSAAGAAKKVGLLSRAFGGLFKILAIAGIVGWGVDAFTKWQDEKGGTNTNATWRKWLTNPSSILEDLKITTNKDANPITTGFGGAGKAMTSAWTGTKEMAAKIITDTATALGFDPGTALTIANIESSLNPNAKAKGSSASGLFGLIDSTGAAYGASGANKNDPNVNASAGIKNLIATNDGLKKFLNRQASGWELYLGEMLGLGGAKSVLSASNNTQLSSLLSPAAISGNHWQGMTVGGLKAQAQKTYNNKQVSLNVGSLNVHSNNPNPTAVADQTVQALSQYAGMMNAYDNGRSL